MGWEEVQVRGYPEFVRTAERYHGRPIFALFCGDKDAEGRSWCPDCVTGEVCAGSALPAAWAVSVLGKPEKPRLPFRNMPGGNNSPRPSAGPRLQAQLPLVNGTGYDPQLPRCPFPYPHRTARAVLEDCYSVQQTDVNFTSAARVEAQQCPARRCPAAAAEPVVRKELHNLPDESVFIYCLVGDRAYWKDPNNEFRKNLKLTGVPTLLKYGTPQKLVEEECFKADLVRMLFTED